MFRWLRSLLFARPPRVLPSLEAYARWSARYPPQAHNPLMQLEQAAMLSILPDVRGLRVVDLACGTGRYGLLAQAQGAGSVIAIDNSPHMLERNPLSCCALATTEHVPLADLSVDVLICAMALGHLPELGPSLREIARVLAHGGAALLSDFHPFAFLSGGQRTFSASDGRVYAVEHHLHLYETYHQEAEAAGLRIDRVLEPVQPGASIPVVIVFRLYKPEPPGLMSM